ncbi:MAG: hypothetical protein H0X08_01475 [Blastocatellia bacterium]|nr:hypothetical protein [Blastocatellia bacterium]
MTRLDDIKSRLAGDWLPSIYAKRVRTQRTRSISLEIAERENSAEILYTLLGIELKVGKRRISCPDLATARYMRVFTRLGCRDFAIPYNITKISVIADELETAWHRMALLMEDKRSRSNVIKSIRKEIAEIGAGNLMPEFTTAASTRALPLKE